MTTNPRPPLFGGAERVQSFDETAPPPTPREAGVPNELHSPDAGPDRPAAAPQGWQSEPASRPQQPAAPAPVPAQEAWDAGEVPVTRRARRAAELMEPDPAASQVPLTGWRRALKTMTFGLASPAPDPRIVEWQADRAAVNANFPRLLTAMVADPASGCCVR